MSAPPCLQYCTAELEKVVYHRNPKSVSLQIQSKGLWLENLLLRKSCNDFFMPQRPPSKKIYFYFHYDHTVNHKTAQRVGSFGQSKLEIG